jgi:CBS domain containing-hemolysin-like protein
MFEFLIGIVIILVCICLEGFFSGTETAMVSVDRARIKALAEQGSKRAALVNATLEAPEKFFSTTLLGTNVSTVLGNAIATLLVIRYLGEHYAYITILIMTPLILVFGEIVPKTIYRFHAEQIATSLVYPIRVISVIFYPIVAILSWLTKLFLGLFGIETVQLKSHATREDIENYLDMWNINGRLRTAEKKIIERIFDFFDIEAEDIMIQLVNVQALGIGEDIDKAVGLAQKTGYSRIPVYSGKAYNIIGIVHAFDLLTAQKKAQTLEDIMRPAKYVPHSAPVDEIFKQMKTEGNSIAVVVDEYGGAIGIITIEDILEEIVGEIYDEYDKQERLFTKIGKNEYLVNARMELDEFNEHLNLQLPKDDYETIAGFLLKYMERIPKTGDKFQLENVTFIIKKADKRSIKEVSVIISHAPEKTED